MVNAILLSSPCTHCAVSSNSAFCLCAVLMTWMKQFICLLEMLFCYIIQRGFEFFNFLFGLPFFRFSSEHCQFDTRSKHCWPFTLLSRTISKYNKYQLVCRFMAIRLSSRFESIKFTCVGVVHRPNLSTSCRRFLLLKSVHRIEYFANFVSQFWKPSRSIEHFYAMTTGYQVLSTVQCKLCNLGEDQSQYTYATWCCPTFLLTSWFVLKDSERD